MNDELRARIPYMPGGPVYLTIERRCPCCNGKGEVYNLSGYEAARKGEPVAVEDTYDCAACGSRGWVPVDDLRIAVHVEPPTMEVTGYALRKP